MGTQLDEASARLARKRARVAELYPVEGALIEGFGNVLEATLRRLEAKSEAYESARCAFCDQQTVDLGHVPVSCGLRACVEIADARRWSELPKADVLRACSVPERYRLDPFSPNYYRGGWPVSGEHKDLRHRRGPAESWCCTPSTVLLCGPNSAGKSMLAAEMMHRAIAAGAGKIKTGFWVTPSRLLREDRETGLGKPRQTMHRARTTGILVLDDFGWSNSHLEPIADLCEVRLSARRPTIWTTHRPFGHGRDSLREFAHMIFTRLRDHAWVFPLEAVER